MGEQPQIITDDLDALLQVLPADIRLVLEKNDRRDDLLEVIMDLGRVPTARYTDKELVLRAMEVTRAEINGVVEHIGKFDADNRAGIERTLHRIAAIRNRQGEIVGLTCRIGRAVYGTIEIVEDLITSGQSILLLGRPAVGKTTMLREAARVLAESKRVVIVDTSNEIAGDGDIPHPAIGRARRMQVATPRWQHEVMIEAVENHNPEVIIIDEIGRELEALAARTIAERGVQLIATAHGNTLENLLLNPTLSDLVGGIESVTLSDDEARRRGTQKTVLERRAPPTFDILIEIQDRQQLLVHKNVTESIDAQLRGRQPHTEVRYRDATGEIKKDLGRPSKRAGLKRDLPESLAATFVQKREQELREIAIYPYGVARNRLRQAAEGLQVPLQIVDTIPEAEVLLTTKKHYRQRPQVVLEAEEQSIPTYVLRANTKSQIESFLVDLFRLGDEEEVAFTRAMRETETAIRRVSESWGAIDLSPQNSYIRRYQHQMAEKAQLKSASYGREPYRHVRIVHEV
ncbi:MAG: R3H domain-containing nucleic acid-binding protein [Chloroflexota bacterium]|nr:R3H domain-containing nucleic acid-binding protein [Chloroflexota bacterium]